MRRAKDIVNHIIQKLKPQSTWFLIMFLTCFILRIVLVAVNDQRNDDHIEPVLLWQTNGNLSAADQCWECFQPALFYFVAKSVSSLVGATTDRQVYYVIQILNLLIGAILLWLILRYIESLNLHKTTTILLMFFWALNPELVSINALATNDMLLFLLGFIILYLTTKLIKNQKLETELILVIMLIAAGVTKGNSLAFLGLYIAFIILQLLLGKIRGFKGIAAKATFIVVLIASFAFGGRYVEKHQQFGDPFRINVTKPQPAKFIGFDSSESLRYGVRDIKSATLEFPLTSLLKQPFNLNDSKNTQPHRENLWTQYLGQFTNYLFEGYPSKWSSVNNDYLNFARVNILVHLALVLLLFYGCVTSLKHVFIQFYSAQLLHLVSLLVFLAFSLIYAIEFRDFSFMKVMFLFPVYMSMIYLFAEGIKNLKHHRLVNGLLITAVILYQINFAYLLRALL